MLFALGYEIVPDGFGWPDLLVGETGLLALDVIQNSVKTQSSFTFESEVRSLAGGIHWVRVIGDHADPTKIKGYACDTSSTKFQKEEAERRYQELFEGVPNPVICYDWHTRRILEVNEEAVKKYGYSKDEFLSMTVNELWPPSDVNLLDAKLRTIDPTAPLKSEWIHVRKDGREIEVETTSHVIRYRGISARVAVVRDITDSHRIERDLRLANERLTLMFGITGTVIGSLPFVEQAEAMAQQVCRAFQVDACVIRLLKNEKLDLLASHGIDSALLPDSIDPDQGLGGLVLKAAEPISVRDIREQYSELVPKMIGYSFIGYAGAPLKVKEEVLGVIAIYSRTEPKEFSSFDLNHLQIVANNVAVSVQNHELYEQVRLQKEALESEVRERIRVEEALLRYSESLRESEERLRLVTEASTDGIWVWDRDTNTLTWSDRVFDLLGLDRSITGAGLQEAFQIIHPDDRRDYVPSLMRNVRKNIPFRVELRLRRGDKTYGRYQLYCTLARDRDDRIVRMVGSLHDITEKVQRDQEMEAVAAISLALREVESTEEMLPIISEQIAKTLELKSVGLALVDTDTDVVVIRHVSGAFQKMVGVRFERHQGFVGRVFGDKEQKFVSNLEEDAHSIMRRFLTEPTAVLGVPLITKGEVIGVLWLGKSLEEGQRDLEFTSGESRMLNILGEIAAASLRRVALRERTEFHLQRLHSLSIIHATVSENLNLRTTLDLLLDQLQQQTKIDAAAIHLYDEITSMFRYETSTGFKAGSRIPTVGRDLIVNRYRSRLVDLQEMSPRGRRFGPMIAAGYESYMAVPLIAKENILGVLEIYHRGELPQDVDLDNFVEMLASQAAVAVDNATLLQSLRTANKELISAYDATIEGWSRALDLRDHETEGHSRRVTDMTVEMAKLVGVPASQIADMRRGALLHDIGKMAIPDSVLHKPGELDANELIIMRRHPGIALDLLEPVRFLKSAIDIPFCHHERWDGNGYPRGLKAEEIPLAARIFAVVDVWDALRSDRPYRKRWSKDQAVHFIRVQSGRQFDPDIVEVFLENLNLFDVYNA